MPVDVSVSRQDFIQFMSFGFVINCFAEQLIGHINDILLEETDFALEHDWEDEGYYLVQNWEREAPFKIGFFPDQDSDAVLVRPFKKPTAQKETAKLLLNILRTLKWWNDWTR